MLVSLKISIVFFVSLCAASSDNDIDDDKDVATSIHQVENLYRLERSFVTQIGDLAEKLDNSVKIMKEYVDSFQQIRPKSGGSDAMHHPINAHLLVRHVSLSWPYLRDTLGKLTELLEQIGNLKGREEHQRLPAKEDLQVTEFALNRLISVYQFNMTQFTRGIISGQTVPAIRSDKKLTVWELGRLAIGLLNQQLYKPAIELLDGALELMKEPQDKDIQPRATGMQFLSSSHSIIPPFVYETMKNEDLLSMKYEAMKNHDNVLKRILKGEIQPIIEGFNSVPFNTRTVKNYEKLNDMFNQPFRPLLNRAVSAEADREQTYRLCRGEDLRKTSTVSKLHCRYSKTSGGRFHFPPLNIEELSLKPNILLVYDMMTKSQIKSIIRASSTQLKRTGGGASMSYKSATLNETRLEAPFIEKLERVTGAKAISGVHSEMSIVKNYGIAGTYGLHSDFRGENNTHPDYGERLATSIVYLTDVPEGGYTVFPRIGVYVKPVQGSALLFWNTNAAGEVDLLTVHSACPVVYGNKWVLVHWINAHSNMWTRGCSANEEGIHQF